MKHSAQILLLLALSNLSIFTLSKEITVTKSFHTTVTASTSNNPNGNDNGEAEEGSIANPLNPGADSYHACDPNNRPEICTFEYLPVCGYINNCEGGACTSTFGNNCTVCSYSNVDGYVKGACEDVQTVCDPDNRPEICPLYYTATCAVAANCEGSHCFENTGNSCQACGLEGAAYSLPGVCPSGSDDNDEKTYCDPNNRPEICTLEYIPVCAHQSNCVGEACWSTAGNACEACGEANVDYHIPGECSDDDNGEDDGEDDGRTYCDEDNRPQVCTLEYIPVCAHLEDCEGDDCTQTAGNACSACNNSNVDYYTPGEC